MDFGPFGLAELVFIGLLALVLFGPRRLPELARSVGSVLTTLRRGTEELKRSFQDELDAADGGLSRDLKETGRKLESTRNELRTLGREAVARGRKLVAGEPPPLKAEAVDGAPTEPSPRRERAVDGASPTEPSSLLDQAVDGTPTEPPSRAPGEDDGR